MFDASSRMRAFWKSQSRRTMCWQWVGRLSRLHRDCFDRLLLAQVEREGLLLITANQTMARHPGPVRHRDSCC